MQPGQGGHEQGACIRQQNPPTRGWVLGSRSDSGMLQGPVQDREGPSCGLTGEVATAAAAAAAASLGGWVRGLSRFTSV